MRCGFGEDVALPFALADAVSPEPSVAMGVGVALARRLAVGFRVADAVLLSAALAVGAGVTVVRADTVGVAPGRGAVVGLEPLRARTTRITGMSTMARATMRRRR